MNDGLKPEDVHVIADTREQKPYILNPFIVTRGTLETGDYSLAGFEDKVTIERKSLPDFIGSISSGRARFEREIERMKTIPHRMILVEGSANDIVGQHYRSRMHPNSIMGTIAKFQMLGIPVMLAGRREIAEDFAKRFLFLTQKHLLKNSCSL